MSLATRDTSRLVERFGVEITKFLTDADRTRYGSSLFDMRKRTLLGMYSLFEHECWFLQEVAARREPVEMARGLKRLCARPNGHIINAIPWSYLVPRENELAMGHRRTEDEEELRWLMAYWAELAEAYRPGEELLPAESGNTQPTLAPDRATELLMRLDQGERDLELIQRTAARLEMMNFVICGEVRGRNFFHGPYPGAQPGATVFVQEFTELQRRQQPWTEGLLAFPVENVAIIRETTGVELAFDVFGFMLASGGNYRDHMVRATAVTIDEHGEGRELDDAELEAFGGHAQEATRGGYERIATWDDDFRILYGLYHYLSEMAPFAEAVGAPELNVELRGRMEETGHRRLADIRAMGDVAPVWAQWGQGGPTFTAP
jgi:hypothetical protein